MRAPLLLATLSLLIPLALATAPAEVAGDQETRVFVIASPVSTTTPACEDASTDAITVDSSTGERWGEVRLTVRDLAQRRLLCDGNELPAESRRYGLTGDGAEFYFDENSCWVDVGNSRQFVDTTYCLVEGNSIVWRFELQGDALTWCDCPAFDLHGTQLELAGSTVTDITTGSGLVFVYVRDAIAFSGTI